MNVCLLGSGSRGNAIYVEHRGTGVLVDQGFSFKRLDERMAASGLDVGNIKAVLVSHEHTDHMNGTGVTARKLKIPVYATDGTYKGRPGCFNGSESLNTVTSGDRFEIGPFSIDPFSIPHDASDPVQYVLSVGGKRVAVATDIGFASQLVQARLRDTDFLIVESNHDLDMLRNGSYPWPLKQRVMGRTGHLSNRNAAELIYNLVRPDGSPDVVLAHLSEENNRPEIAEREVLDLFEKFDRRLKSLTVASQDKPTCVFSL